jgi:hypothetical protein
MNLSDAASAAGIVSSAAVAVSLVYLALQVRQAERNQRGLMQQGRADRVSDYQMRVSADPALSNIAAKGHFTPEQLTLEEFEQYANYCRAAFLSGEDSFLQHRAGLLDDAAFHSFAEGARLAMRRPGYRAAWRVSSGQFGPAFVAYMDAMAQAGADSEATTRTGRFEAWRRVVREVSGSGA